MNSILAVVCFVATISFLILGIISHNAVEQARLLGAALVSVVLLGVFVNRLIEGMNSLD